jgi:hypothetical protein
MDFVRLLQIREPATNDLLLFCKFLQKAFLASLATELISVPAMSDETELSLAIRAASHVGPFRAKGLLTVAATIPYRK